MNKIKTVLKSRWFALIGGVVLGALVILGIRFAAYKPEQVHYHANFAVYINGQREQFKEPQYYQEVAICNSATGITLPQQRAHMHDNINDAIHIHDHAVTWGQFFENLGWYIGPDFIQKDNGNRYVAEGDSKLHVIIDDQDYTDLQAITNVVIKDRDRLLVSFGDIDQKTLAQEYKAVPNTAKKYDESQDPASCAGSEKVTFKDRLHHLF